MTESNKIRTILEKMSDIAEIDEDCNEQISEYLNMTYGEYLKNKINKAVEEYRAASEQELNTKMFDAIKTALKE